MKILSKLKNIDYPKRTAALVILLTGFALTFALISSYVFYPLAIVFFFLISFTFVSIINDERSRLQSKRKNKALLLLGFKANQRPNKEAIKKAYKKVALEAHPERSAYPESATAEQREAIFNNRKDMFMKPAKAYYILQNYAVDELSFDDAKVLFNESFGISDASKEEVRKLKL